MGNLLMADLGGNIYKYDLVEFCAGIVERRLAPCRTAHKVWPVTARAICLWWMPATANGNANVIYKFTAQGVRSIFAPGPAPAGTGFR